MPILFLLLWGSGFIFIKFALEDNEPLTLLLLRLSFAALIAFGIFLFQRKKLSLSWPQIGILSSIGILLQAGYQLFFLLSVYIQMPIGVLTIILGTQPILTLLILRESFTSQQLLGLLIGFSGLFLVVSNNILSGMLTPWGMVFATLSLLSITYGTILQKKYCADIALVPSLFIQYLAGSLFIGVIWMFIAAEPIIWSTKFILSLTWLTVVISIGAIFLFYVLLKKGKAVKVTSLLYCLPVITAVMDYLVFQQTLSTTSIIGMIIVISGLLLIHATPFKKISSYSQKPTQTKIQEVSPEEAR